MATATIFWKRKFLMFILIFIIPLLGGCALPLVGLAVPVAVSEGASDIASNQTVPGRDLSKIWKSGNSTRVKENSRYFIFDKVRWACVFSSGQEVCLPTDEAKQLSRHPNDLYNCELGRQGSIGNMLSGDTGTLYCRKTEQVSAY